MFSIEMKHIGKIEAVGTVQVFGYSSRRIDEHVSDMIYLNFAGPATAAASVWATLIGALTRECLTETKLTAGQESLWG